MSKYLFGALIVSLAIYTAPASAGDFFSNVGRTVERATHDVGRSVEKATQDTGSALEKAAHDTGHTIENAGDTSDWTALNREQGGVQLIPVDARRHKM
jgi:hypothetical protein